MNLNKGWLFSYLLRGDELWTGQRWGYWCETIYQGRILPEPIPELDFLDMPAKETMDHLDKLIRHFLAHGARVDRAFEYIVEWILFGFGSSFVQQLPPEPFTGASEFLYKEFKLGLFQKFPADSLGSYFESMIPPQFNPTSIFMTPMSVCKAMASMIFADVDRGLAKGMSVCDPCLGSGRMLMVASAWSLNLFGQDLDSLMCLVASINAYLYIPWLARPSPYHIEGLHSPKGKKEKQIIEPVIQQPIEPETRIQTISQDQAAKHKADKHGQLLLFDFEK